MDASVQAGLGGGPVRQEPARLVRIGTGSRSPDQVADPQVLDDQQAVAGDECPCRMVEVAALVGELAMTSRQRVAGPTTVGRPPPFTGQGLLGGGQPGGGDPPVARIGHTLAVASGGEAGDPDVDPDRGLSGFQGPGGHLVTRQDQHPAAPFAANLNGLDPAFDLAVDGDLHLPDPLQVDLAGVGMPAAAVTVLGPFHPVEPLRRPEPRVARRLTGLDTPEERGEGPVQTAQGRLLRRERPHRHIRSDLPDLLQLSRLVSVADSSLAQPPRIPSLLQRGVIQLAMRCQASAQGDMLASGRPQPKLVGPPHSAPRTSCNPSGLQAPAEQHRSAAAMIRRSYASCTTFRTM